jgi:DNA primase
LSLGDSRLKPLRVENLLTQIKPSSVKSLNSRTSKPLTKTPKLSLVNTERSLLERAEASLLIVYLHSSQDRQIIIEDLETRNLEFSLSHHRFLWQQIAEFPLDEIDLISSVQNKYLELSEELEIVSHLFHLNEKIKQEILVNPHRNPYIIQTALACMERVFREKRYYYFREQWEKIDPQTEPEKSKYYAEAMYIEKIHLHDLEKQRQFSITDLI